MSSLAPVSPSAAAGPTMTLPPQLQQQAQQGISQGIQGLGQFNTTNIPAAGNIASNLQNNPYAPGFIGGSAAGGFQGQNAAQDLFGAGGAVLNTAFDPQQQLYNQYLKLTNQQAQANAAQAGLGTSPYGVGLANQADLNFNLGWQQQQLQNQIAGLGAAGQAFGEALPLWLQSALAPYAAYQGVNQDAFSALSALQQYGITGATIPQQQINDWAQLLGLQPQLAGAQNQTALTQSRLQQTAVGEIGGGIAAGAGLAGAGLSGAGFSGPGTSMLQYLGGLV